jgi:hypothetical protein
MHPTADSAAFMRETLAIRRLAAAADARRYALRGIGELMFNPNHLLLQRIVLIALVSFGAGSYAALGQKHRPEFRDYPAARVRALPPARADLSSSSGSRYYRTRLREAARKGPNFAGHYTIVTWGCGSDCFDIAVVDARTGRVWFAPFTGAHDLAFRLDSRLLIVDPRTAVERNFPNDLPPGFEAPEVFFVWKGNRFVQVYPTDGTKPLPAIR